jgi:hypothetical protein
VLPEPKLLRGQKMKTLPYDMSRMMAEKSLEEQSKGTVRALKAVV